MKKFISLLVAFAITINFFCVQVAAADEITKEQYQTWEWEFFESTGELRLASRGSAAVMPNFSSPEEVPWAHLRERVTLITSDLCTVGDYAFYGFTGLTTELNVANFLKGNYSDRRVGKYAFAYSTNIPKFTLNTGIKYIDDNAFEGCTSLVEVAANDINAVELGNEVFKNCTALTKFSFPRGTSSATLSDMGVGTFEGCTSLSEVTIDGLTSIKMNTFKGCTSLTSYTVPSTVTEIGDDAFRGSGLASIRIGSSVNTIGAGAFADCLGLESITIPDNITAISNSMFSGDAALKEVKLNNSITSIGDSAFNGCTSLTGNMVLPYSVTSVQDYAFNGCTGLTAVFIPDAAAASGGNIVSGATYKVKYEQGTDSVKITSIEGGDPSRDENGEIINKIDIPDEINGLPVKRVDSNYFEYVSQNHNHNIEGGQCTLCGKSGGMSGNTSWTVDENKSTGVGTLIVSPAGRPDTNYETDAMADYTDTANPDWYAKKDGISKLQIRDGVSRIGNYSFYGMNFDDIIIPSTVTHIGNHAFSNTTVVDTAVWIPASVTAVGDDIFSGSNVNMIFYPSNLPVGNAFPKDENTVLGSYIIDGDTVIVTITQGEELIGSAGYDLPGYDRDGRKVISENCVHRFTGEYGQCEKCGAVWGGNIGKPANPGDPADSSVTWHWSPANNTIYIRTDKNAATHEIIDFNTTDHKNPFDTLMGEQGVTIENLVFEGDITYIGDYFFKVFEDLNAPRKVNITEINLPSSLKEIGVSAFEDCRRVVKLTIPGGVETIGDRAFYNLNFEGGYTYVEIPESVKNFGDQVFVGCSGLYWIAYPDDLMSEKIFETDITVTDGNGNTTTTHISDIIPQAFKIAYNSVNDSQVEVIEILPGRDNTVVDMPQQICGKDVIRVIDYPGASNEKEKEQYRDLVNKETCPHTYKNEDTNKCPVCGKILGDASADKDAKIEWTVTDGILKLWCTVPEVGADMKDFTMQGNQPWREFLPVILGIEIGEGIRNIGNYAFAGANYVAYVTYPSTLYKIGDHAFERCGSYDDVVIPASVKELGTDVFYNSNISPNIPNQYFIFVDKDVYLDSRNSSFFTESGNTQAIVLLTEGDNPRVITGAVLTNGCPRTGQIMPYERHNWEIAESHTHCFNELDICILCGGIGGYCGPGAENSAEEQETTWVFDERTGLLTITSNVSGNGRIGKAPWLKNYKEAIKSVFIEAGVTSIGVATNPANRDDNPTAAFKGCTNLSSVTFETGSMLDSIEASSFEGCSSLAKLDLPVNVTYIGENAFNGCNISGRVIIPANIRKVGENSFNNCGSLTALMIPENYAKGFRPSVPVINLSNPNAAVLVYSNDGTTVMGISVPAGKSNVALDIPEEIIPGVSVIKIDGLYNGNVQNISSVTLPQTVKTIGDSAFAKFGSTDPANPRPFAVNIPYGVTSIGESAFAESAIENIAIPDGVTSIPANTFSNCSLLRSATLPATIVSIGDDAFASCDSLVSINSSNNNAADLRDLPVKTLGNNVFAGCSSIEKIVLPATIENVLDPNTFLGCTSLDILEIPEVNPDGANISSSVVREFKNNPDFNKETSVIIYRWIANDSGEGGAYRITSAVLGNENNWGGSITNDGGVVDDWLFVWSGHEHCYDHNRQCVLCKRQGGMCGPYATWSYDSNSYRITINAGTKEDGTPGDGVMWNMVENAAAGSEDAAHYEEMWGSLKDEIREVVINEGIVNIGNNAFKDCPELVTVRIPASVETIGTSAFEFAMASTDINSKLKIVYIADGSRLSVVGDNAFKNSVSLTNIGDESSAKLPDNLKRIKKSAFENCSRLSEIIIPDSVTEIGERAFAICTNLSYAKLPLNLGSFGDSAFLNCVSLTEIVVSPGVTGGTNIFAGCTNLRLAVIPNNFSDTNFVKPDPESVTRIKYTAIDSTDLTSDRIIREVCPVPGTPVTIPDYIMGSPVTEIGIKAFKPSTALDLSPSQVTLPSTLIRIDDFAFEGCTWLQALDLSAAKNLSFIGTEAFEGCLGLTEMVIPDTVTDLGMRAFHMCEKLETVKLSGGLKTLKEGTFEGCKALKYVVVPEGVTSVENRNFKDCVNLEYVVLPLSMRNGSIDFGAFENCPNLAAIYVPTAENIDYANNQNDAEAIITAAQVNENGLRIAVYDQNHQVFKVLDGTAVTGRSTSYEKVLNIPEPLTVRQEPAHQHCFNIHNQCIICGDRGGQCGPNAWWILDADGNLRIYPETDQYGRVIESTIDHDSAEYFGTWTEFKDRIYTVTVEEGITLIDSGAFQHCLRLQAVSLPDSLEYLQDYAFGDCISLVEIDLPDGIISLGEGVFMECINLRNVVLPKSISELPKDTFKGCRALESIKLPSDLRYVREGAFSGCINLKSIELPVDTRTVSEDAFSDCTNLTYIVAPDACRYIFNENEFPNATYFKYAPEGIGVKITYARPGANVHHLIIPSEISGLPVVAIGDDAFIPRPNGYAAALADTESGEQGLISITIPSTVTEIGNNVFKDRTDIRNVTVEGSNLINIGDSAFEGCTALSKAELPSSIQKIGARAFYGCVSLSNIPMYEGLLSIGSEAFANCGFSGAFVIIPSTVATMGGSVFGNVADNALIAIPQKLAMRYADSHNENSGSYPFRNDNCGYVVYRVDASGNKWVVEGKLGDGQTTIIGFENYMKVAADHVHCLYRGFCVLCNFAGGTCGVEDDGNGNSNAKWYIDRDGNLHIEGSGAMKIYTGDETAPWRDYSSEIKNIIVHDGITTISPNAFTGCDRSASVTLPGSVRSIGENAFRDNKLLTSITIPENVTVIPENAFNGCTSLAQIDFPQSLERIEAGAFAGCTLIKYLELPAAGHDIYIDNTAFEGGSLEYIAMPEGTVITAETTPYDRFTYRLEPDGASVRIVSARLGTTSGSALEFPSSVSGKTVKAIGGSGYANVVGGTNISDIRIVTIPEGVTEIYADAFADCANLFRLSLPETLETIGERAFSGCGRLTEPLVFKEGLKQVGDYAFSDCDGLDIVKLPLSMESVGNYAFSDCDSLDIIVTPRNVIDNRGYTPSASLVYYERRSDGYNYIAAARLGSGKTNIDVAKVEALGVRLDIDNHEHCYNEGVCVLCNDDGGLCGVGMTWSVNGDTLEIKLRDGLSAQTDNITGEMYDFTSSNPAPWFAQYKDSIRKLVIGEGVISIGNNAFVGLTNLTDINEAFPSTLTKIGENAFATCTNLVGNGKNGDTLWLNVNIKDVAGSAFMGCTSLKRIILPDDTEAALSVSGDTAVIKYCIYKTTEAHISKIEIEEGKKTDVPNCIFGHRLTWVAPEYRRFVSENHEHYHQGSDNRCTICDMISGECGENTKWYIDQENKRLIIHGEGGIRDFDLSAGEVAPWTQYAELFDDIIIREPVNYIGDNAFVDLGHYDEITLPPSIIGLGENVFAGTTVRRMYIPGGLNQNDRDKLDSGIEKVYYQVTEDRAWVDVTRIELPAGVSKISIPKTIYHIPVRSVAENYRQYVDQNDGHEHDYGDEHGECECRICGKVTYNHIWEDGWNHDKDHHWHDCERGDYGPEDGNLDGSGYGDHDWKEVERKAPTATEDGWVRYECFCGAEKTEVLPKTGGNTPVGPDNPSNPGTGGNGGFAPPPDSSGSGGDTTNPPSPGNNGGGSGGNNGGGNNGGNNGGNGSGNTPYVPQPWETTAPEKPPVTNPPSGNLPDVSDFNGDFTFNIEQGGDSMPAKIADSTSNIIKAVLSEEEQDKLINGTSDVQIILSVTKGDGTVSLRDRAIISAALGEYKLGEYMDISLYKVVDGVRERITQTSAPLTITIDIPGELRNSGRRFRVIRAHDGSATVLRDLDNTANTVTISTDRFSPYVIAYTDSVNVSDDYDPPMPTGDPGISVFIFVTMASGLTAVSMTYFNHASDVEVEEERRKKIAKLVAFGKKGKVRKYIAIGLIFLVTIYYQGLEGIQGSRKEKSEG